MRVLGVVRYAFLALIVPAVLSTIWLYLYPVAQNCQFPTPSSKGNGVAPIRLLALGDPQLEGDTSLPDPNASVFPGLVGLRNRLWIEPLDVAARLANRALKDIVTRDIPRYLQTYRKKLDLLGNDYYLAHIYRTTKWWTQPTHVSVLGDLLGSQWISDQEFDRRADRFWNRVFVGAHFWKHKTDEKELGHEQDWDFVDTTNASQTPALLNVAGNHDIGYAGDIDHHRIDRFEHAFGHVNWRIRIPYHIPNTNLTTTLHLVNLNSMNLDQPALNQDLHHSTHHFLAQVINDTISRHPNDAVILLTHIPLFKPSGICIDPPFFSYFPPHHGAGIREQNHLSETSSNQLLNLFNTTTDQKRAGIILNGHDHEGCDTYHHRLSPQHWNQTKYLTTNPTLLNSSTGIREITVRSMMGEFGGNAGLLAAWFDIDTLTWKFEYATCVLGKQHFWWAVHVVDCVVGILGCVGVLLWSMDLVTASNVRVLDIGKTGTIRS